MSHVAEVVKPVEIITHKSSCQDTARCPRCGVSGLILYTLQEIKQAVVGHDAHFLPAELTSVRLSQHQADIVWSDHCVTESNPAALPE